MTNLPIRCILMADMHTLRQFVICNRALRALKTSAPYVVATHWQHESS